MLRSPLICALQSSTELVELRAKLAGPPAKAKYYSMTDSEQVGRLNDEKHSDELNEKHLKPCTYKRSEHYASQDECVTAYLLHNGPASVCLQQG
jgi:hypothetical protein